MRLLVALGGNALLARGEPMTVGAQRANAARAAQALAALVRLGHGLIITHGNGPQVGLIALQAAAGPPDGAYPLDVLGAESEGMVGYLIEQELRNALPDDALIATLLTQTRVDAADAAFAHPTKPIGPVYDEATARSLASAKGWAVAPDGAAWRRVVASPEPLEVLGTAVIAILVERGVVVICAGGGGVPVVAREGGGVVGVEAVVDKDRASGLLARALRADALLLLTDVDAVQAGFGTAGARAIARAGAETLRPETFAAGSMRPKVEAAALFARATGRPAGIGRLQDAAAILVGAAGTTVVPGSGSVEWRA